MFGILFTSKPGKRARKHYKILRQDAARNGGCNKCGKYGKDDPSTFESKVEILTVDHKIPLSKEGSNQLSNIQVYCYTCNQKKGNKLVINVQAKIPIHKDSESRVS